MIKRIAALSLGPLIIKVLGTVVAFMLSVALARTLGVVEFGAYSLVVSAVMVLAIPIQSGLPILAVREVSRAHSQERAGPIHAFVGWSNRIVLGYFLLVVMLAVLFWQMFPQEMFARNLLIAIVSVATISVTLRDSAVLRGLGHFMKGTAPDVLVRPAAQLAAFGALVFATGRMAERAPLALSTFVFASALACLMSFFWRGRSVPNGDPAGELVSCASVEPWRKAAVLLTVVGGGQILFGHIDTLMLGIFASDAEVGAYRVAVQLSMLVIFALTVVNQVLQPKISELYAQRDMDAMQSMLTSTSLVMFLGTLVPAFIAAVIAPQVLEFVFGADYRIASTALQILIVGQAINVMFGSVGTILNMTGLENLAMRGMVIAIVINLGLDVLLIPLLGLSGAALASALTITIWNAILRYYVKDRLGIESSGVIAYSYRLQTRLRKMS